MDAMQAFDGDPAKWESFDHGRKVWVLDEGGDVLYSHYMGEPEEPPAQVSQSDTSPWKKYCYKVAVSMTDC